MNRDIAPTPSLHGQRYLVSLVLALAALVTLAAPACSGSSNVAAGLAAEEACHQNSDCARGLFCALGACRAQCKSPADCGTGGICIDNGDVAVCQYADENNTPCNKESDCPSPLACASDYRCRNLCSTNDDCNVLGISGRVCAKDANGVDYCAIPAEVTNGTITAPPPPGAMTSTPVMEPADATVGTAVIDGAPGGDGSLSGDGSPGGGSEATSGDSASGGPDASTDAPAVCVPGCSQGQTCVEGATGPMCIPCGSSAGLVCCNGQICGAHLTCTAQNSCACGSANQACCGGNSCNSGLSCNGDDAGGPSTCACGEIGTRCCPGLDGGAPSCTGGAICSGTKCSCVAEWVTSGASGGSGGVVRRIDGTVWSQAYGGGAFVEMNGTSGPLRASSITSGGRGSNIGCALVSGGVWCFPMGGVTLTDSTYLGAGLGSTDSTSAPVQVVTSVGGAVLANVQQIAGSGAGISSFCAVLTDGSIWCWGYDGDGQLGHGDKANGSSARPVMATAGTQFANAVEVRMGANSACARKSDGSVWCWGNNGVGQLGIPINTAGSLYPVQVPFLGSGSQRTATRLTADPANTHCSIMMDTSVVCWGDNGYLQAGAASDAGSAVGPTSVRTGATGPVLTGIIDLAGWGGGGNGSGSMCARDSNFNVICWGRSSGSPYPSAFTDSSSSAVGGIQTSLSANDYCIGYITPGGLVSTCGDTGGTQPPCTNLLP